MPQLEVAGHALNVGNTANRRARSSGERKSMLWPKLNEIMKTR